MSNQAWLWSDIYAICVANLSLVTQKCNGDALWSLLRCKKLLDDKTKKYNTLLHKLKVQEAKEVYVCLTGSIRKDDIINQIMRMAHTEALQGGNCVSDDIAICHYILNILCRWSTVANKECLQCLP